MTSPISNGTLKDIVSFIYKCHRITRIEHRLDKVGIFLLKIPNFCNQALEMWEQNALQAIFPKHQICSSYAKPAYNLPHIFLAETAKLIGSSKIRNAKDHTHNKPFICIFTFFSTSQYCTQAARNIHEAKYT